MKIFRPTLLIVAAFLVVIALMSCEGSGVPYEDPDPDPDPDGTINPSLKKPAGTSSAVSKGLTYIGGINNWGYVGSYASPQGPLVIASFCGLAMLASGSDFDNGDYSSQIKSAADYVSGHILDPNPVVPEWDQTNWMLTIGSVFLAEAYKSSNDASYKSKLESAISRLVSNMEPSHGYAHGPGADPNVLNYTELAVMSDLALLAMGGAKKCSCSVSEAGITNCKDYLEDCTVSYGGNTYVGYSHVNKGPGVHRTAGAIKAFDVAGVSSDYLDAWKTHLVNNFSKIPEGHGSAALGYLNCALGCMCVGQDCWDDFVSQYFSRIMSHQNADGSYENFDGDGSASIGVEYRTGIYTLILQLDLGHLYILSK